MDLYYGTRLRERVMMHVCGRDGVAARRHSLRLGLIQVNESEVFMDGSLIL